MILLTQVIDVCRTAATYIKKYCEERPGGLSSTCTEDFVFKSPFRRSVLACSPQRHYPDQKSADYDCHDIGTH